MSALEERTGCGRLHVVLVAGGAGSGKSVLIRHLVSSAPHVRVASLHAAPARSKVLTTRQIREPGPFDHLLIELAPQADPRELVQETEAGVDVATPSPTQTLVAVVNAETALADFCSHELIRSRIKGLPHDDLRSVADVLTDQIECARVLVLNKIDRLSPTQRKGLVALLTALNPDARLAQVEHGRVAPSIVLKGDALTEQRPITPGWRRALEGNEFPDAQAHGISTLVYRERRPFHPMRLQALLGDSWPGVVRSRGFFWIASRPDWIVELSQAGAARRYRAVSTWWAATLEGRGAVPSEVSEFLGIDWDPHFGDRRHELVFVGIGLDVPALKGRLDACLLTDEELRGGRAEWQSLHDPFPLWSEDPPARLRGSVH